MKIDRETFRVIRRGAYHGLVWGIILSVCLTVLWAVGLLGLIWRFFKWLVKI